MANSNISSIGRFSSQMLTYLGTQKVVKSVNGTYENTFKYANGPTVFPNAASLSQSFLGEGVTGNISAATYNSSKSYFLSRGASTAYADAMTAMAADIAASLNITPQYLLEKSEVVPKLMLSTEAYRVFNALRDPAHQVGTATSVSNRDSLQARQIRA